MVAPISPHMLFDRPLVLDPAEWLELTVAGPRPGVLVVDGRSVASLGAGRHGHVPGGGPPGAPGDLRATRLPLDPPHPIPPVGPLGGLPMLVELRVRDLGVIEDTTLDIGAGYDRADGRDRVPARRSSSRRSSFWSAGGQTRSSCAPGRARPWWRAGSYLTAR